MKEFEINMFYVCYSLLTLDKYKQISNNDNANNVNNGDPKEEIFVAKNMGDLLK